MRTAQQRILNAVQHPERYREQLIDSSGFPVALSLWEGDPGEPVVLFLPGTMTHPLFYEEFLDALNLDGLTVVGLHPAGHGKSPRVRRRLTFEVLIRNVHDALEWARTTYPGRTAGAARLQPGRRPGPRRGGGPPALPGLSRTTCSTRSCPRRLGVTRAPAGCARLTHSCSRRCAGWPSWRQDCRCRSTPIWTCGGSPTTPRSWNASTPTRSAAAQPPGA